MAKKASGKIPQSAEKAANSGYSKKAVVHSTREKQKWVMLKHKGKWAFTPAASTAPPGPHTVCYYDPNTGFYDDCHES